MIIEKLIIRKLENGLLLPLEYWERGYETTEHEEFNSMEETVKFCDKYDIEEAIILTKIRKR